ncbi:MAG: SDR family oxidoreductase [Gemmatimonadota bacterium]
MFVTGFPGFLASGLLPNLLARGSAVSAVCLVEPRFVSAAHHRIQEWELAEPSLKGRIRIVEGDITEPDLGLGPASDLKFEVSEIFHLAAIYDLAVAAQPAQRVNVDGTRHVIDFAAGCGGGGTGGFERLHYVSTCYVSGRYAGAYSEADLDKGQKFNNHYEETKFRAEVLVQNAQAGGLPATIYRPSIVVGDSHTGATQKYDGPYAFIRWILRQRGVAVVPKVGDPDRTRLNVVPSDYVTAAITALSALPHSVGRVYQLADPEPPTIAEFLSLLEAACGRRLLRVPLRASFLKAFLLRAPAVSRLMGVQPELVDYMVHPTYYTAGAAAEDLKGTGITVPPLADYVDKLVTFVRSNPKL